MSDLIYKGENPFVNAKYVLNKPSITGNTNAIEGMTYSVNFVSPTIKLTNVNIQKYFLTITLGTSINHYEITASNNTGSYSYRVPSGTSGQTLVISLYCIDELYNKSPLYTNSINIISVYTLPPTIVSPVASSTINGKTISCNITYNGTNPSGYGTHTSTDWILLDGETVVSQSLNNTTNKLSYNFTTNYRVVKTLTLKTRVKNSVSGYSDYATVTFTNKPEGLTAGGRLLYRHSSNKGTVMEFNDGTARKVVILDAQYRPSSTLKWGTTGTDTSLTQYSTYNTRGDSYLNTSNTANTGATTTMTDAQINSLWANTIDAKTGKQNCDVWMTYNSSTDTESIVGVPSVAYARSQSIDGTPCDIPNIQTLMRIFLEANNIDSLDPTVSSYSSRALGTASGNHWRKSSFWTSTMQDSYTVRCVNYKGDCQNAAKYASICVVPVLELNS